MSMVRLSDREENSKLLISKDLRTTQFDAYRQNYRQIKAAGQNIAAREVSLRVD